MRRVNLLGLVVFAVLVSVVPARADSVVVGGSGVLTQGYANQLAGWLYRDNGLVFSNVFSGAPGTAADFHAAADGKGATFTVAEVVLDVDGSHHIVGGYNPFSWEDEAGHFNWQYNGGAFIYNLTTGLKLDQNRGPVGETQTYNFDYYGPTFGGGHDLLLLNNRNPSGFEQFPMYYGEYAANYSYGAVDLFQSSVPGQAHFFRTVKLDVFTFEDQPVASVPESSSLVLLSCGLIAISTTRSLRRGLRGGVAR